MALQTRFLRPSPFLAPYVDYYFVLEDVPDAGNSGETGAQSGMERQGKVTVLPAPQGQMVFTYGTPSRERWMGGQAVLSPDFAVGGYANRVVEYSNSGGVGAIMVGFKPWGLQAFLDCEVKQITNANSPLDAHYGRDAAFVEEMLREAGGLGERIRVIEAFLAGRLRRPAVDSAMVHAVGLIASSRGSLPVEDLARECCLSRRQFLRRFEAAVGIGPKMFSRIVRFQRVFAALEAEGAAPDWDGLVAETGYFDQAHFINDFKDFAGMAPARFREALRPTAVGRDFSAHGDGADLRGRVYL